MMLFRRIIFNLIMYIQCPPLLTCVSHGRHQTGALVAYPVSLSSDCRHLPRRLRIIPWHQVILPWTWSPPSLCLCPLVKHSSKSMYHCVDLWKHVSHQCLGGILPPVNPGSEFILRLSQTRSPVSSVGGNGIRGHCTTVLCSLDLSLSGQLHAKMATRPSSFLSVWPQLDYFQRPGFLTQRCHTISAVFHSISVHLWKCQNLISEFYGRKLTKENDQSSLFTNNKEIKTGSYISFQLLLLFHVTQFLCFYVGPFCFETCCYH